MRRATGTRRVRPATTVAGGLAVVAAVCCVWTWMAYTYLLGTGVSVSIGDECLGKLQNGTEGTIECWDASWPLDGVEQRGTLIDYRQSGGMFEFDAIRARAFGETARTRPPIGTLAAGVAGPALFAAAGITFLLSRRGATTETRSLYR